MRVVMTGATSGIGLHAAERLIGQGTALIVGCRAPAAAPRLVREGADLRTLDLDSLKAVRAFAASLKADGPIDALVLNAGVQCIRPQTSVDGFERTFAVNHLAHALLARLLAHELADGGRIIITSSGTHDPLEKTGMPPPRHADAALLARPKDDPKAERGMTAGQRAYSSSKLCNLMTARELAVRLSPRRADVAVIAFDPGFTPGTGLARDYPGPVGAVFRRLLPLVMRPSRTTSTPATSGRRLAELVLDPRYADARGDYYAVRDGRLERLQPSTLARDKVASARLWDDTAGMIGLEPAQ